MMLSYQVFFFCKKIKLGKELCDVLECPYKVQLLWAHMNLANKDDADADLSLSSQTRSHRPPILCSSCSLVLTESRLRLSLT